MVDKEAEDKFCFNHLNSYFHKIIIIISFEVEHFQCEKVIRLHAINILSNSNYMVTL